ncbi:outer membrane protein TolC [Sinobacterium caligoides]|uniref:Outer membrane protein TolC n=1 Tax=Sinobacterium caligoides TaxID=933926 RepID=A0A3N2DYY4_9GAMM|nr:TolC family protein [Sinobacterium caligoides]ROS05014.1 outer membrane protein TolC [Sinobacterium caligoides]
MVIRRIYIFSLLMSCSVLAVANVMADQRLGFVEAAKQQKLNPLTLSAAIELALRDEPGALARLNDARAMASRAIAGNSWEDPKVKLGVSNLPTDSFDLDQEAMTQLKLGLTQAIPRGDSHTIIAKGFDYQAQVQQALAMERLLKVRVASSISWLESWYAERANAIYQHDQRLFNDLLQVAQALYRVGKRSQADVLKAQLEIDRQRDQLQQSYTEIAVNRAALSQYIGEPDSRRPLTEVLELPVYVAKNASLLLQHPSVIAIDRQLDAARQQVALAKEAYKPAWSVNVEYGKRLAEDQVGQQLPDMLSASLSVDIPLFTRSKQDPLYLASQHQLSALLDQRGQLLRELRAQSAAAKVKIDRLEQRIALYKMSLLPTAKQSATTDLNAYQSGQGGFQEVLKSRLFYQQVQLDYARLRTDLAVSLSQSEYFYRPLSPEIDASYRR